MSENFVENVAGRMVLTEINGRPAVPLQGVGKYTPTRKKAAPPIRSCNDHPADGDKVVNGSHAATEPRGECGYPVRQTCRARP